MEKIELRESEVELRQELKGSDLDCRNILAALPSWFGIEDAVDDYVAAAEKWPTVIALINNEPVGFVTVRLHNEYSAEIYVMAVLPEHHRHGIGRMLLHNVESFLAERQFEFLHVKTLSEGHPDAGYEKTRAFYRSYGFRPLEELPTLWDNGNPALLLVKDIGAPQKLGATHETDVKAS